MNLFKRDNYRPSIAAINHDFYIQGPIGDPEEYIDLIDTLYTAKGNDNIQIYLNTPGGRLDTTVEIIHAMAASEGNVTAIATGTVASAGTLILFSAEGISINRFAYAMLHDGSGGEVGKINENLKSAEFHSNYVHDIYHEVYSRFFSKEEIDEILNGKDLYLTSSQLEDRVRSVAEESMKEVERQFEELQKSMEELDFDEDAIDEVGRNGEKEESDEEES
jgi:ATP-dependent protease ClpP protease subunit